MAMIGLVRFSRATVPDPGDQVPSLAPESTAWASAVSVWARLPPPNAFRADYAIWGMPGRSFEALASREYASRAMAQEGFVPSQ